MVCIAVVIEQLVCGIVPVYWHIVVGVVVGNHCWGPCWLVVGQGVDWQVVPQSLVAIGHGVVAVCFQKGSVPTSHVVVAAGVVPCGHRNVGEVVVVAAMVVLCARRTGAVGFVGCCAVVVVVVPTPDGCRPPRVGGGCR